MTAIADQATYINEQAIFDCLSRTAQPEPARIRAIFAKAKEMQGLTFDEVATLIALQDPELTAELFATARAVKEEIYGSRLVMFAPLYISNRCTNECEYCAYRASNRELHRITLTQEQIAAEIKVIVEQGHKRILMVAGEAYPNSNSLDYVFEAIKTIYATRSGNGVIRRVNVNIAPLQVEDFRKLKACGIGTYQCFQETYHRETYAKVHPRGRKSDYDWRATVMDRAMEAGIDDVGIGPLFGIYDWRFEVLAMLQHIHHLEERFGCGPHTISVPRLEPAAGTDFTATTPWKVSDAEFLKLIAILRLTVPYTGMIMSTRESAEVRRQSFQIGISQTSAGSRTDPGGYGGPRATSTAASSPWETHARSTRSSAKSPRWDSPPPSAPPATDSAAPAQTSWTSPNRAPSSTTASPTRSPPSPSIWRTTPAPKPRPPASSTCSPTSPRWTTNSSALPNL